MREFQRWSKATGADYFLLRLRGPPHGKITETIKLSFRIAAAQCYDLSAMDPAKLRVVIFQEGEWLCARSLEYGFATPAKNLDDLRYDLERMIVGHIAVSLANGLKPFRNRRRAPEKYWTLFRRSKISLPQQSFGLRIGKRGLKIPTPEIRGAPLAA